MSSCNPARSRFEKVTWAVAILLMVAAGCFFTWILPSAPKEPAPKVTTQEQPQALQPAAEPVLPNGPQSPPETEPQKTVSSDELRGSIFMGFAGYQKGMEWAANYGRVPTNAEYEMIKLSSAPPEPASSMDKAFYKAFLDGFEAGCKEGLQQRRPAF